MSTTISSATSEPAENSSLSKTIASQNSSSASQKKQVLSPRKTKSAIYFDYNASTPVSPHVYKAMQRYFMQDFGNPSTQAHTYGRTASSACELARKQVASFLNTSSEEIIFTSGATESNNMVIQGLLLSLFQEPNHQKPIHIITSQIEHKSVLGVCSECVKNYKNQNIEITYVPPNRYGQVQPKAVLEALKPNTVLVSIMAANNEIGTINPVLDIANALKNHPCYFHTDAAQAVGKIPFSLNNSAIDFLSFSGHKLYAPKGIGALYIKKEHLKTNVLKPLFYGGQQEHGLRPGTLNVPGIVALGAACQWAQSHMKKEDKRLQNLQTQLIEGALAIGKTRIRLNGHPTERLVNNVSFSLLGVFPERLQAWLGQFAYSAGSACNSQCQGTSHVLKAIGLSDDWAQNTLRLGLGLKTTSQDIDIFLEKLEKIFQLS